MRPYAQCNAATGKRPCAVQMSTSLITSSTNYVRHVTSIVWMLIAATSELISRTGGEGVMSVYDVARVTTSHYAAQSPGTGCAWKGFFVDGENK